MNVQSQWQSSLPQRQSTKLSASLPQHAVIPDQEHQVPTQIILLQGICTHVSDVKPHIVVATYTDAETGYEVYQQVTGVDLHLTFC